MARDPGDRWFAELSHGHLTNLLAQHGFTVVARQGFTLVPRGGYRHRFARPGVRRLDDLLCRSAALSRYATDVLYLARRTG